jgi:hypothetical protein
MDFDPRDYDSRDDEQYSKTPSRGGRSGSSDRDRDNDWSQPGPARAIAMTMMRGRWDVVPETSGKDRTGTERIPITIPAGPTETATIENAIARARMHSADMFTCLADRNANWFITAIASTPCAVPNPGRSRPSVHSEWSPVVISETTMGARLIHGRATCDTSANKG